MFVILSLRSLFTEQFHRNQPQIRDMAEYLMVAGIKKQTLTGQKTGG